MKLYWYWFMSTVFIEKVFSCDRNLWFILTSCVHYYPQHFHLLHHCGDKLFDLVHRRRLMSFYLFFNDRFETRSNLSNRYRIKDNVTLEDHTERGWNLICWLMRDRATNGTRTSGIVLTKWLWEMMTLMMRFSEWIKNN